MLLARDVAISFAKGSSDMSRVLATVVGPGAIVLLGLFASVGYLLPAQLTQARVTKVIGDMRLLPEQGMPRAVSVNDDVRLGTRVRTGTGARGELIFADKTLTRLGADTILSLKGGPGEIELGQGVILLQVPKAVEAIKINAGVAVSAISGTAMLKYDSNYLTLIVLDGKARLSLEAAPRKVTLLRAGQLSVSRLRPQPAELGDISEIDLKRLMDTSLLVKEFPRLASQDLIEKQVQRQSEEKAKGELIGISTPAGALTDNLATVDQAITARSQSLTSTSQLALPLPVPSPPPLMGGPSPSPTPAAARRFNAKNIRVATHGPSPVTVAPPNKGRGIGTNVRDTMNTHRRLLNLLRTGHGR
jgi:FecR protein